MVAGTRSPSSHRVRPPPPLCVAEAKRHGIYFQVHRCNQTQRRKWVKTTVCYLGTPGSLSFSKSPDVNSAFTNILCVISPWRESDWTDSDDRVRGGKSQVCSVIHHSGSEVHGCGRLNNLAQSYLKCSEAVGRFTGELDIKTLGGAGFASQRTTGDDRVWDLSGYAGILLDVAESDCESSCHACMHSMRPLARVQAPTLPNHIVVKKCTRLTVKSIIAQPKDTPSS